jgi:hypothetical protein
MTNYTKITNFAQKDTLTPGDANKKVKGTEIDAEFNAIASASATKADLASPALTGTPTAPTAATGTDTTQIATTAFVQTELDANPRIVSYQQVVKASDQTINTTTKTDLSMDLAITPSSATNKILLILNVEYLARQNLDDVGIEIALYVDDVLEKEIQQQFASSSSSVTNAGLGGTGTIIHLDSPATTSEVTYSVKASSMFVGGDGSEFYAGTSTLTALEIEA